MKSGLDEKKKNPKFSLVKHTNTIEEKNWKNLVKRGNNNRFFADPQFFMRSSDK